MTKFALTIINKKNLLFTRNLKNISLKRSLIEIFYVDLFCLIKTSFLRYKNETPEIIMTIFKTEKYFIKNVSALYNPPQLFYTHTINVLMSNCSTDHVLCYPLIQHVFVSILGNLSVPISFLDSTTENNNLSFFDYYNLILEMILEDIKKYTFLIKIIKIFIKD